ncbi:MAG TPA: helix-turn-helix transcriptional regulator [Polyangiales bacterium]|nr:helix-turn-helix transcriptional regulator [Polyangiales bacterium]
MEQDDKVSIAALSTGSIADAPRAFGASGTATERTTREEDDAPAQEQGASKSTKKSGPSKKVPNNVRKIRNERMMSKAELARRANLSVLTIDRVERGYECRVDTKRKLLEALGLSLADRVKVFGEEE